MIVARIPWSILSWREVGPLESKVFLFMNCHRNSTIEEDGELRHRPWTLTGVFHGQPVHNDMHTRNVIIQHTGTHAW